MHHQKLKEILTLISCIACIAACNADEGVEIPDVSSLLFKRDWGKNIQSAIEEIKRRGEKDPVIVIYKDSAIAPADDRIILITPSFQKGTEEIGVDPIIEAFKVYVANPDNKFETSSKDFRADQIKAIEDLWLICSKLVISAGKAEGQIPPNNQLEERTKYYIFSTVRTKEGIAFFSGHMAGMIHKPGDGAGGKSLIAKCDDLISSILPLE